MSSDIQIDMSGGKPQEDNGADEDKKNSQMEDSSMDATDYLVEGAVSGGDLLKQLNKIHISSKDDMIYGVTDNTERPLFDSINDFFVDRSSVGLKDKSYFFHMLAVMVDAGIPVVQAVKSLAARAENIRFKRILNTVAYNCEGGSNLSEAMSRFEDVFDDADLGIVRSGEATGRLDKMLFKLSQQIDKKHDLHMKLWSAAVYPIAVLSVLVLVAVGMLVWVFPTLLNLLQDGGISKGSLPLPTRILMFLQTGLVSYWWALLLGGFGLYGLFSIYVHSDYGALMWDYRKLKMPFFGKLMRKIYVYRFVSLLGLLIESGLPVIKSLKIAGSSISNRVYKLKAQSVIDEVRVGKKISSSLEDTEFLFPAEVTQMLRVGESSASLGEISEKVAGQFEREIDNTLKKFSSVFEPFMILFVGVFVALLALAIMMPIFNLSSALGT